MELVFPARKDAGINEDRVVIREPVHSVRKDAGKGSHLQEKTEKPNGILPDTGHSGGRPGGIGEL